MATKAKFQAIKGTRDLLPPETELWVRVESTAREVFGTFGFGEIRPPIFEPTELFARAVGGETDIVSKEMYSFGENPHVWLLEEARREVIDFFSAAHESGNYESVLMSAISFVGLLDEAIKNKKVEISSAFQHGYDEFLRVSSKLWELRLSKGADLGQHVGVFVELVTKAQLFQLTERISLRPEATASVCRAYIEHNMNQWPAPVKLYYAGPMFRRERPQKGRYRQFYQIGAEVLGGTDAPGIDAEVIEMVMAFFARLELPGVVLEINSIGHAGVDAEGKPVCRRAYVEALRGALELVKDKLGADSQRRIETNPLRVLDSKLESEQGIIAGLPKIGDYLCEDCAKHYAEVKRQLDLRGVAYRENWRLVRGLDYYMRTTFEITAQGLGSQNAVCGGGRYDGLIELLGGPATKGIGFAIGEDRLILSLLEATRPASAEATAGKAEGEEKTHPQKPRVGHPAGYSRDVYVAWMGEKAEEAAVGAARRLREAGLRVELPAVEQKFGKALGMADRLGARFALILGEDEVASGMWTLKSLADGSQEKVPEGELVRWIQGKKV